MAERLPWFRCFPAALLGAMAGLEADEGLIYVTVLLRIYETGGPVHESGRTLARRTGLTERRATAAVASLIDLGKIICLGGSLLDSASTHDEIKWQTERRSDQSSAGKASAAKRQKQASVEKNDASLISDDANDTKKDQQKQQIVATSVEQPFNHLEEDKELEEEGDKLLPLADAKSTYPVKAFEIWYLGYPHKVGKKAAERAFDRIRKSNKVTFEELTNGVANYKRLKPATQSYCHPATWLNEGRWDDEPNQGNDSDLFGRGSSGSRPKGAGQPAVAAAVARHADRERFRSGGWTDDPRPGDEGYRRTGGDDPEITDADWSTAPRYSSAH